MIAGVVIETVPRRTRVAARLLHEPGLELHGGDGDRRLAAVLTGQGGEALEALAERLMHAHDEVIGVYPTYVADEEEQEPASPARPARGDPDAFEADRGRDRPARRRSRAARARATWGSPREAPRPQPCGGSIHAAAEQHPPPHGRRRPPPRRPHVDEGSHHARRGARGPRRSGDRPEEAGRAVNQAGGDEAGHRQARREGRRRRLRLLPREGEPQHREGLGALATLAGGGRLHRLPRRCAQDEGRLRQGDHADARHVRAVPRRAGRAVQEGQARVGVGRREGDADVPLPAGRHARGAEGLRRLPQARPQDRRGAGGAPQGRGQPATPPATRATPATSSRRRRPAARRPARPATWASITRSGRCTAARSTASATR